MSYNRIHACGAEALVGQRVVEGGWRTSGKEELGSRGVRCSVAGRLSFDSGRAPSRHARQDVDAPCVTAVTDVSAAVGNAK